MAEQMTYPRRVEFEISEQTYLGTFYKLIDDVLKQTVSDYSRRAMSAIIKRSAGSFESVRAGMFVNIPELHVDNRRNDGTKPYTVTFGNLIIIELFAIPHATGGKLVIRWRKDGEQLAAQFCAALASLTGLAIALPGVTMEPLIEVEPFRGPGIPPVPRQGYYPRSEDIPTNRETVKLTPLPVSKEQTRIEDKLSAKEREVFAQIRQGLDKNDIAKVLGIERSTVATHVQNICRKLELSEITKKTEELLRLLEAKGENG